MAFMDFLFGSAPKNEQLSRYTPQIQSGLNQNILQQLQGLQGNKGFDFAPIAQQRTKEFQTSTIPGLAERFTSMNGQNSSAFQGALGQAGSDLQSQLASLQSQYGLQAQGQQNNLLQSLLGLGQQENLYHERQPGFLENLGTAAAGGLGQAAGLYATGGLGGLGGLAGMTQMARPQQSMGGQNNQVLNQLIQLLSQKRLGGGVQ